MIVTKWEYLFSAFSHMGIALFLKKGSAQMEKPLPEILITTCPFQLTGECFFFVFTIWRGFFIFLNFQIRKANSKNSGHDVCFWSLISFVSKGKSLIPVCININLCKHQKQPKERYYPQCWSLQTFFSFEKNDITLDFGVYKISFQMKRRKVS